MEFLRDARELTDSSEHSIIAVHCRGGKGRTGSLCCAWLLYSKTELDAEKALAAFAKRRTDRRRSKKLCGVETPSQVRYVRQLAEHLKSNGCHRDLPGLAPLCPKPAIKLQALDFKNGLIAKPLRMGPLRVLVQCGGANVSEYVLETASVDAATQSISLDNVAVCGDVRVSVFEDLGGDFSAFDAMTSATNVIKAKGLVLLFLFHTNFLHLHAASVDCNSHDAVQHEQFAVPVEQLDKAHKNVKRGKHAAGSSVVLNFIRSGTD